MNVTAAGKQRILILSGDLGDGHKQAARALLEAAELCEPNVPTKIVDFLEWTHPHLHSFSRYCYIRWLRTFPGLYGYLFQKTRDDNSFSHLFKKIRLFGLSRMLKLLQEENPTVVVCTFPSAAAAMSILKQNGLTDVPTVTVITDHTDHSYWVHPGTDRYLVGSDRVKLALSRYAIPEHQITVTGIPVRPRFCQPLDKKRLCERHGLDPSLPTVMVMGGGLGMIGRSFIQLLLSDDLPHRMQFVIVCGHNEKLRLRLMEDLWATKHSVHITGYVDYVHELMAVSDLLITKPGGLTTAEALSLELPMLLFKPLPGQEQDNATYLTESGLALSANNEARLMEMLVDMFENPVILHKIKYRAKQKQTKMAATDALHAILSTKSGSYTDYDLRRAIYAEA